MPKDDYAKAKRGDIARRATSQKGFAQREAQRNKAKSIRSNHSKGKPHRTTGKTTQAKVHPKQQQIDAAEHRVAEHGTFFDFDILLRLEQAAMGSGAAFWEALVMMRQRMHHANES